MSAAVAEFNLNGPDNPERPPVCRWSLPMSNVSSHGNVSGTCAVEYLNGDYLTVAVMLYEFPGGMLVTGFRGALTRTTTAVSRELLMMNL
jgi:hypothetical protein